MCRPMRAWNVSLPAEHIWRETQDKWVERGSQIVVKSERDYSGAAAWTQSLPAGDPSSGRTVERRRRRPAGVERERVSE